MQGETGENPVRARRREAPAKYRVRFVKMQIRPILPRCHNLGNVIGET